jgi:hypothetical protein
MKHPAEDYDPVTDPAMEFAHVLIDSNLRPKLFRGRAEREKIREQKMALLREIKWLDRNHLRSRKEQHFYMLCLAKDQPPRIAERLRAVIRKHFPDQ